jgi:hypothetical protein
MRLAQLQVLHFDAAALPLDAAGQAIARAGGAAWVVATCQRTVLVGAGDELRKRIAARLPLAFRAQGFAGAEAYAFLLRFACGLESRLVGETEIFGQVKESWREFSTAGGALAQELGPLVQQIFQDTKEVRAHQLSGLGSASYGSQVRRLLGGATAGATLLVGAGQLAQAVAPWIETGELIIWNRTRERAIELARLVQERNPQQCVTVPGSSDEAELAAWARVADVVLCVPEDEARDGQRIAAWTAGARPAGRIVHLGLGEGGGRSWSGVPGLTSLTALFDMLRVQEDQRTQQVRRARRACAEKAMLRSLGSSTSQAHGWEDLAAFATIAS